MKNQVFEAYKELNLGNCKVCIQCKEINENKLYYPLSIYSIGENFHNSTDTILFVGKTARGGEEDMGILINNSFIDVTEFGNNALDNSSWHFYAYTREIIKNYFGSYEEGKKNIAFTNLIKCNSGTTQDATLWDTKMNCLENLSVVWKEIEVLKPKRIIFYTHKDYDYFINRFLPSFSNNYKDITDLEHKIQIGKKNCFWWHRDYLGSNGEVLMSFLRLSHPERKKKVDYVNSVVTWLNSTKNISKK